MTRISPWLSVADTAGALDFYVSAFGAVDSNRLEDADGTVQVVRLSIDDAEFWVQLDPEGAPTSGPGAVRMILSVDDPDDVYDRAIAAGATPITPVYEGHGWRIGRIADPSGHHWEVGRPL